MNKNAHGDGNVDSRQANTARSVALMDWLTRLNARCLWQQRVPGVGTVECWATIGRTMIVCNFLRGNGFEVYTPGTSATIQGTFADAEARIKAPGA
jgi:hypothetical protein